MAKRPPKPDLGMIVEFEDVDSFRVAAVTGFIGTKKLVVITADGAERRTSSGSVTWRHHESVDAEDGIDGIVARLDAVEARVEEFVAQIELDPVWSKSPQRARSYEEIAEDVWENPNALQRLAMLRALRRDHFHFRSRKKGWEPRPADTVERLRAEAAERARLAQARQEWIEAAAGLIEATPGELPERLERAMSDAFFRSQLEELQAYAIEGDSYEERRGLDALLDRVEDTLGYRLRGSDSQRAFWFNVRLGIFDEYLDLQVERFQRDRNSEAANDAARQIIERGWEPESWRRDLTDAWTCTIDDATSKDLDDAISVDPVAGGGWILGVHIADPSTWVQVDDEIDRYARYAGTSLYLPTGVVPMFPRVLSEGLMSLTQGEDRPVVSTLFKLSPRLAIESVEVVGAVIRVDRRLSYDEVDAALHGAPIPDLPTDSVSAMRYIADEFHAQRQANGAVTIDLPEIKIEVDTSTEPPTAEVRKFQDSPARALVGELMIATNVALADYCIEHDVPVVYRGQEPPDGDLYDDEIMAVEEGPAREIARLKRMRKGEVSTRPERHAGLGVPHYVQSTSPIRRYTDLMAQRQVKAHLAGEPLPYSTRSIEQVLSEVERAVYEAREVERASHDYWMTWVLGRVRGPISAQVVDVRGNGRASVFLTDYGYRAICSVKSDVSAGDEVLVEVTRADPRTGNLSLREARTG